MNQIPVRQIKAALTEPSLSGSFNIRNIRPLLKQADMKQPLHRHEYYFILFLEKGKGEHIIDFEKYTIRSRTVFIMRPGQVHQLDLKKGSQGYLLEFDLRFYSPKDESLKRFFRQALYKSCCIPSAKGFQELNSILQKINKEYQLCEKGFTEMIRSGLDMFFISLARESKKQELNKEPVQDYYQEKLEELLSLLEKNLTKEKKVAAYARLMHLSVFQLNHITRNTLGKTCSAVINDMVILEAKRQLLATHQRINQIAASLGYEDSSYFIRFFRKLSGYPPDVFRQKFR
ncbi:MAG TPA: AraC family transcriptional regulator [Chitinophagaceae bacterium]|nr:AraC family transcriptional regulator [Chitinophagaceae bacterium]